MALWHVFLSFGHNLTLNRTLYLERNAKSVFHIFVNAYRKLSFLLIIVALSKHVIIISRFKGFIFMCVKTYDYNVHVEKMYYHRRRRRRWYWMFGSAKIVFVCNTQNDNCQSFIIYDYIFYAQGEKYVTCSNNKNDHINIKI